MDPIDVRDEPGERRYAATADGRRAGIVTYRLRPGVITLIHTIVEPGWEGRGVGASLARGVLDDARARGLRVVPRCPFIAAWIRRHPEYAGLVGPEDRRLLEPRE